MKSMKNKTQNGQVLLITLLVLTIIGIVIVGLVTLSNRDVTQVVTSEKYEKLYNTAETEVRKLVDNFGKYDKPLSTLSSVFNNCAGGPDSFNCPFEDATIGNTNIKTDVTVIDQKDVIGFEVKKDRSLVLKLTGYTGIIDVSWDKAAAVEFTLIAQDGSRNLKVIKDVYDLAGVYEGLAGDNPYNQPNANHNINYQVKDASNNPTNTRLNITPAGVKGLVASDYVFYLTLTPRMRDADSSLKFTITNTTASFPKQIREFIATTRDTNDTSSPLAKVITQIPLAPQMDSVFDYALISNSAINSY